MTFAELQREVTAFRATERPSYISKMLHSIPRKDVVERNPFIADLVRDKIILDIGASGQLHQDLHAASPRIYGLDLNPDCDDVQKIDLEDLTVELPHYSDVKVIVACEILEHLTMPGFLLSRLRKTYPQIPLIVSVPNAFSRAANYHMGRGVENINCDHVAWYSPKTLEWLLGRHGYTIRDWAWYNGQPYTAEGIVAVAE